MLFLPDSYIEKYGKKLFILKPIEQINFLEFEFKYVKMEKNEIEHIIRNVCITSEGDIKIIDKDEEYKKNLGKQFVKNIFEKIYAFIDRGGLKIEKNPNVGGYSVNLRFTYSDNSIQEIPADLKFPGLFEEYLGVFLIEEIVPLFENGGINLF